MEALPSHAGVLAAIPHVNVVVSLAAVGTVTAGVRAIGRGDVRRHRAPMTTSFGLFALFLALYLYRVAVLGPTDFTVQAVVRTYVHLPVRPLGLAVVCVPFVFYALLVASTRPVAEMYETRHRTAGRVAASP